MSEPSTTLTKPLVSATVRAAVYVRISMDREGAGLGVARQEQDCRALAERRGWSVTEVYADNDVSATSAKPRPEWQRLLADVRAGHVDAIVGWHIDRLTRKPRELEDVIDLHDKHGLKLATVTGEVDLATPTGQMVARILASAARHEVAHKSERQRRQRLQAAQAGKPHVSGFRPFGYLSDFVTPHPVEAPLVADAARRVLAGESLLSVTRSLNEAGATTTTGKPWTYTALRQVLKSARISGRRETGLDKATKTGEIVAVDCWPAIVSPEASDRLRTMLTSRKRGAGSTTRKHLLSGVLTCGRCGASMAAANRSGGRNVAADLMYRCNPVARGTNGEGGCGRMTVTRANADHNVIAMVLAAIDSPDLADRLRARPEVDPGLVGQVEADERELIDIAADRAEGVITRKEWLTMREVVDARLKVNRAKLAKATNTDALTLLEGEGALRERFDRLNVNQQRAVICAVLVTVRVVPGKPGRVFDVNRLQPEWRV